MTREGLGPEYRKLWTAAAVSTLGDGVREAALPLLAASRVSRRFGPGRALLAAVVVHGVTTIVVALTSNAYLVGVCGALGSLVGIVWNVITVSLRQAIIPDDLLGRVNSVYRFLGWGMMPVGAALGGAIATAFGLRATYWVGGVVLLAMAIVTFRAVNNRAIAEARVVR